MTNEEREQNIKDGERRWPNISQAIDKEAMLDHLNKWITDNPADCYGIERMQAEIFRYLMEKLKDAPQPELLDAVCENASAVILDHYLRQVAKAMGRDDATPGSSPASSSFPC